MRSRGRSCVLERSRARRVPSEPDIGRLVGLVRRWTSSVVTPQLAVPRPLSTPPHRPHPPSSTTTRHHTAIVSRHHATISNCCTSGDVSFNEVAIRDHPDQALSRRAGLFVSSVFFTSAANASYNRWGTAAARDGNLFCFMFPNYLSMMGFSPEEL